MSEKRIKLLTNATVRGVLRSPAEGGDKGILAPIGEANDLIKAGKAVDLSEKRASRRSGQGKAKPKAQAAPKRAAPKSPPACPAPPPPAPSASE